jgi:hypothetical protein
MATTKKKSNAKSGSSGSSKFMLCRVAFICLSEKAVAIIQSLKDSFPDLIAGLAAAPNKVY